MNRILLVLGIVSTCALSAAACSSPPGHGQTSGSGGGGGSTAFGTAGGASLSKVCGLTSACFGEGVSFGQDCEQDALFANLPPTALGTEEKVAVAALHCLEGASDCASARLCDTVAAMPMPCTGSKLASCSGALKVYCGTPSGSRTMGTDCRSAGLVCVENTMGADCAAALCDPDAATSRCDGDFLLECDALFGGGTRATNCARDVIATCDFSTGKCQSHVGETCGVVDGEAMCVGKGAACDDTTFTNACDGTTVVSCTGGKIARQDCAGMDARLTCRIAADGSANCDSIATECGGTTPESCATGVITYCLFGTKATFDCKGIGLSGCTTSQGALGPLAACTP